MGKKEKPQPYGAEVCERAGEAGRLKRKEYEAKLDELHMPKRNPSSA